MPTLDPLSAVSSSINVTIKILEVTYQLKAVDEQTADLLSTTRHVGSMVQEARRLRRLNAGLLNTSERTMIDNVISDTEDALRAVAKLVEPCRVDKVTKNSIKFGHRVMWVFRDNPSVRDKHQKLQICHQSLTIVFTCLYSKDVVVIAPATEGKSQEQPPPYDPQLKELLDWQNRRKSHKSLGEREGPMHESRGLTVGSPNNIPVAGPSSPCLLPLPLDNDGRTSSSSTLTDMFSESLAIPIPELQSSVLRDDDKPLSPAIASPEASSRSPHVTAQGPLPNNENQSKSPTTHTNGRNDYISPTHELPKIKSPAFATIMAAYNFDGHDEDGQQVDRGNSKPMSFSAQDTKASSSAIASNAAASDNSFFPTTRMPTSSRPSDEYGLRFRTLETSRYKNHGPQAPPEVSSQDQYPLRSRTESDIHPRTACQSDRLDAVPSAEDATTRDNRAMSVGEGLVKRGGRSWLAYHATRSDRGQSLDFDG